MKSGNGLVIAAILVAALSGAAISCSSMQGSQQAVQRPTQQSSQQTAEEINRNAMQALRQGNLSQAQTLFQEIVTTFPGSKLAEDARAQLTQIDAELEAEAEARRKTNYADYKPAVLTPEAAQALAFINQRFVAHCSHVFGSTYSICSHNDVLSIVAGKVVMDADFEETHTNGTVEYSHETDTVSVVDLDLDSLVVVDNNLVGTSGAVHVDCKSKKKCVSVDYGQSKSSSRDQLIISNFYLRDVREVGGYLKRVLELQQGSRISAIEHEPTEEEALSFIKAHLAPAGEAGGGFTYAHRDLTVQGDELVEVEDVMQYGKQPGHLVVRGNLNDMNELVFARGSEIVLSCSTSNEGRLINCFSANTGQSLPIHVIMGVSNPSEFVKMLKRLIILHKSDDKSLSMKPDKHREEMTSAAPMNTSTYASQYVGSADSGNTVQRDSKAARKLNSEGLRALAGPQPNLVEARRLFQKAVQLDPENVELLNNLGDVVGRLEDYKTAEAILAKVLTMAPKRRVANGNMGYVEAKLGNIDRAEVHFCEYIRAFDSFDKGRSKLKASFGDPDPQVQNAVSLTIANCRP
jgi:Tfp pilus assembly protein PilF